MGLKTTSGKDAPRGDQVAEAIGRDLLSGHIRPGEALPTELELSERFGVSRASVRSGLQSLAASGIVERLVGQGTVVQEFSDWNILDPVVTGWLADHDTRPPELVRAIFEFRYTAEPLIAAIAARNSRALDLLAMEHACNGMAACVADGDNRDGRFTEYDVSFHVAVYKATHNAIWARMAHILRPAITILVRESNSTLDELELALVRHQEMMEAIRMRDPARSFDTALRVMQLTAQELGIEPGADLEAITGAEHRVRAMFGTPG